MLNKVVLIGRLTKDPEIRVTTTGISVGTFSLAVNRNYTSSNGERETDFFNCVCYRKLAEIVGRYVKKGQLISVDGRIQNRSYNAQDGTKRYITEIICENVVFLESSRSQNTSNNSYQQPQQPQPTFNINREQPNFNNNNHNNYSKPKDNYFEDNPNVDISEDDLPF
ncbi:single-stranded DNA-binding protein [Mycoplasmatota bacterium]|nr:single-stranded DNA-binding protein [Mycoplasmatota bacterium]